MEDAEMKHNSTIKQLMREFNTQMALRERELESAVKETIGEKIIDEIKQDLQLCDKVYPLVVW